MREKMKQNTEDRIRALVEYGMACRLTGREDAVYAGNQLLHVMQWEPGEDFDLLSVQRGKDCPERDTEAPDISDDLESILRDLLDDAVRRGVIEDGIASRDLFDTELMGCLTPRPGEVIRRFRELYQKSPEEATDYFYRLCRDCDYIRTYRIKKDRKWKTQTEYGELDITINLSKPEKDPKAIAAAAQAKTQKYPKCLLCPQNEGYAGRLDHPARQNLRLIPLTLGGEDWYMQYSPYVYYNEHCIVLSGEHVPMKIDRSTFRRLLEFVGMFPHYTVGSNADLPIVGGSILSHEHFQGGRYTFAMAKAPVEETISFAGFEDVEAGIVKWPMSVIRLDGSDPERIEALADRILQAWRVFSDPSQDILAFTRAGEQTDGPDSNDDMTAAIPHNTITPIARRRSDGAYELDLVLRNNRTTQEHPLGIFHPHAELHHIKKENIGLIEVMGLAVLPARLLGEMQELKEAILAGKDIAGEPSLAAHADWARTILRKHPSFKADDLDGILQEEIGLVFAEVLEHCGVFRRTETGRQAFRGFLESV